MSRISKIIKAKRNQRQKFVSPPLVIPVGAVAPETANQTMARLMLTSGVISRDDYEKMLGVRYDIDNDEGVKFEDGEDYGDYKDDYELSIWSEYEREIIDVNDNPSVVSSSNLDTDGHSRTDNTDSRTDNGNLDGKEKNIEGSANAETNSTSS